MSTPSDGLAFPEDFSGNLRIFPLPNLVLFPHVIQPLHIFEPRYVSMLESALADDELLGMSLLQPGWEEAYEQRPPIYPVVCVGRVISHSLLEGGTYNLLLQGLRRATVIRELDTATPFRVAEVAVLEDLYPSGGEGRRARTRDELFECLRVLLPESPFDDVQLEKMRDQQLSLGALVDIVAYSLDIGIPAKQQLLTEWDVDRRAAVLLDQLRSVTQLSGVTRREGGFPPQFSRN